VTDPTVEEAIIRVHHVEWARVVAGLARRFGDLDVAEEATAEAFLAAAERWPREGVPPNPGWAEALESFARIVSTSG
jgi:RNA polymerase sigma-70 factor (ECF subfamily)